MLLFLAKIWFFISPDATGAANCACGGPILSKMGVSFFSTPRSIFRIFVLFLVTKFLFLELLRTGPVSGFLGVRDHLLQRLMHSWGPFPARVALFGDSNFSAWLFLVTNVTIFSKNLIFHISGRDGGPQLCLPGAYSFKNGCFYF